MIRSLIVVVVVVPAPRSEKSKQILHAKTHVFNLVTTQRRRSKCALLVLQLSMKLRMWDNGPVATNTYHQDSVLDSIVNLELEDVDIALLAETMCTIEGLVLEWR